MEAIPQQLVNGISLGMLYALLALGYTLVYGILRMINFSHGDVFMVGGFVGWGVITLLLTTGVIPGGLIVVAALLLAMILCGALGYGIERFAYRPLRNARSMGVIISGLGVSIFLQTAAILIFGARFKIVQTERIIPPSWQLTVGPVTISFIRFLMFAVALVLMVGLEYFILKTKLGKATRATSQDIEAAAFMGIDVDRIISMTYIIGSALAGVGGVMVGMLFTQVDFGFGFFIGIKAFTAAVIGGIGSIRGAVIGGLVLGIVESVATGFISPTYKDVITFVLLVGVLLIRPTGLLGKPLRVREAVASSSPSGRRAIDLAPLFARIPLWEELKSQLSRTDRRIIVSLGILLIAIFPQLAVSDYMVRVIASVGLFVVLTVSLNVMAGYSGLLNLGHIGFYAVGAYMYGFFASAQFGFHLPFLLILAICAGVAALLGAFIGAPSLRLRGDYLAMVTLAFAEIIRNLALTLDRPVNITGGVNGLLGLDLPAIGPWTVRTLRDFYYLIWIFAVVCLFLISRLRYSRIGRAWLAIREDEVAAGNMGINIFRYKLLSFAVAALFASMAGAVFAAWQGSVFPESFTIQQTAIIFCMLVVSGAAGMPGIVIGAAALTIIPEMLRDYGIYRMLLFGALLVLVMRYRPQGFFAAIPRRSSTPKAEDTAGPISPAAMEAI